MFLCNGRFGLRRAILQRYLSYSDEANQRDAFRLEDVCFVRDDRVARVNRRCNYLCSVISTGTNFFRGYVCVLRYLCNLFFRSSFYRVTYYKIGARLTKDGRRVSCLCYLAMQASDNEYIFYYSGFLRYFFVLVALLYLFVRPLTGRFVSRSKENSQCIRQASHARLQGLRRTITSAGVVRQGSHVFNSRRSHRESIVFGDHVVLGDFFANYVSFCSKHLWGASNLHGTFFLTSERCVRHANQNLGHVNVRHCTSP